MDVCVCVVFFGMLVWSPYQCCCCCCCCCCWFVSIRLVTHWNKHKLEHSAPWSRLKYIKMDIPFMWYCDVVYDQPKRQTKIKWSKYIWIANTHDIAGALLPPASSSKIATKNHFYITENMLNVKKCISFHFKNIHHSIHFISIWCLRLRFALTELHLDTIGFSWVRERQTNAQKKLTQ